MAIRGAVRFPLELLACLVLAVPGSCALAPGDPASPPEDGPPPGPEPGPPPVLATKTEGPPATLLLPIAVTPSNPFASHLQGTRISQVVYERRDVFERGGRLKWVFDAFNYFHYTTQERVIAREILLHPGDLYDPVLAEESERILRRLSFLADARVYPVPLPDGTVALHVETKDRFTLRAGASFGIFSGSSTKRGSIGESNLFGLGKSARFSYEDNDTREQFTLAYEDPQFFATHHELRLSAQDADDGQTFEGSFEMPFRTLSTEWGYFAAVRDREADVNYLEFGDEIEEIPVEETSLNTGFARAFGPRTLRHKYGMAAQVSSERYGAASGSNPTAFPVPGDTEVVQVGPTFALEYLPHFVERQQIDSMGTTEDLPLGLLLTAFIGLHHRHEDGEGTSNQTAMALTARWSQEVAKDHVITLQGAGSQRVHGGSLRAWTTRAQAHYYYQGFPYQTLAASISYEAAQERDGLEPQFTLGEESGLRGYPSDFFAGDRRLRINLEDRVFPDWELLSVRLGLVAFFDAGLAWDHRDDVRLSDLFRSVGLGLRLGSPELVRSDVVRIDLAFPLDRHPADDFSVSLSVAAGQVFDLFGNADTLDRNF